MSFLLPAFMTRDPKPYPDEVAEPWDEDGTKFKPRLYLRANTWKCDLPFPEAPSFPEAPCGTPARLATEFLPSPCGTMGYVNARLPRHGYLPLAQGARRGHCWFDGPVVTPTLWKVRGGRFDAVWMGVTPMEILTQRRGIRLATGTCVVGGLGLGWFLKKIHAKPAVRKIVVVEESAGLLEWFGTAMCAALPKVTDVICGDVREQYGRHGAEARYLIDIWLGYGSAPGRAEMDARKAGCKIWCWGEYADRMQRIRW